jgi:hypothetical protein
MGRGGSIPSDTNVVCRRRKGVEADSEPCLHILEGHEVDPVRRPTNNSFWAAM